MAARLRKWFERLSGRSAATRSFVQFPEILYAADRSTIPLAVGRREFFVVGSREHPKWAIFGCPCEDGHLVEVTLVRHGRRPSWRLTTWRGRPTLNPSIHVQGEHSCHYVIRRGTVQWVRRAESGHDRRRAESDEPPDESRF
jgi:hypothetical protein